MNNEERRVGEAGSVTYTLLKKEDGSLALRFYKALETTPSLCIYTNILLVTKVESLISKFEKDPYFNDVPDWWLNLQVEPFVLLGNNAENTYCTNLYNEAAGLTPMGRHKECLQFVTSGDPTYNHYPESSQEAFSMLSNLILTGQI